MKTKKHPRAKKNQRKKQRGPKQRMRDPFRGKAGKRERSKAIAKTD